MKIAVINEGSTKHRNADLMRVLQACGHDTINLGMRDEEGEPDLNYLHTATLSALAIHLKIADFVVGGCGTGQGYLNAVLQFPGMSCGLILDPVDAWLFSQVNAGNCISLALNKGYGGIGADINLSYIFEKLFADPFGQGYPSHRQKIQQQAKSALDELSVTAHLSMPEIMQRMDSNILRHALQYPGVTQILATADANDAQVDAILQTLPVFI